jgi:hypothetical protein
MKRREFIAGLGSGAVACPISVARAAGDRARNLSIDTSSLKAGPNEISGLLPFADEWLTTTLPAPSPLGPLGPMDAQVGRWRRSQGCQVR